MGRATIATVLGLALVVIGGLWWLRGPAQPLPVNASQYETDMTEGLVRGILGELAPPVPPVCFLAFGEGRTPPSSAFIARFAGSRPAVRSCGSAVSPPIGKYFETASGRPGLIVHIVKFKQSTPSHYDVVVAFSNLPHGHDHFIYRIYNLNGEWITQSRKPY